ncbi:disease resistance protein RGA2-like [Hevea brasiliensis]|uniref:disease resistance protein RGA2-like n=1 Tax=Hevea brasiliensis TaxID=3981 RepID=UPI0025EC1045|nr:disease resistance protein RGA2-like [Hevea brasiliensis]
MAEEIAFNITEQVIAKVGSVAFQDIELISGAKDDLKGLENSLTTIKAVLIDAEEKREKSLAVKSWLRRLQDIVYEAEELVDTVETKDLQKMVQAQSRGNFATQKEMIIDVRHKSRGRETSSVVKSHMNKENIIKLLLILTSQGNVSVNAIVVIGGLGKTALAQLVYNDENVQNYFEKKMWVCVSEEFDVKLLVKKILECATNDAVPNLELEKMHNSLKRNLEGKRCLLVLDDVWNEVKEKWDSLKDYLLVRDPGSTVLVTTRSPRVASAMGVDIPYVLQGLTENEAWDLFKKLSFGEGHGVANPNLIKTGKEMVKKCKGAPLAKRSSTCKKEFRKPHAFEN